MNKKEFHNGDLVTYHPYELSLPARVSKVQYEDGSWWYGLRTAPEITGQKKARFRQRNKAVLAKTTGRCIEESNMFGNYDE